ncbi:MAG TPA: MarR family transcriptional regulator [Isoptericola sp.]|nr:MarR family transcriptional regulator [Isoptericola sp.]
MREPLPPRRTPDRQKARPTWLLGRAAARSSALLAAAFADHGDGLRGYHYRLLAALEQWGPESQADLGRDTGIDRSDVTGALRELEERGLVEREEDSGNRRRKIVSVTPAGVATLRRLDGVLDDVQKALLEPLSAAQRRQFTEIMALLGDS